MNQNMNQETDNDAVRELLLFAENDRVIYDGTHMPFVKNYNRKMEKGIYSTTLAIKGVLNNYVPRVVKAYNEQIGEFPVNKQTKIALAAELLGHIERDIKESRA